MNDSDFDSTTNFLTIKKRLDDNKDDISLNGNKCIDNFSHQKRNRTKEEQNKCNEREIEETHIRNFQIDKSEIHGLFKNETESLKSELFSKRVEHEVSDSLHEINKNKSLYFTEVSSNPPSIFFNNSTNNFEDCLFDNSKDHVQLNNINGTKESQYTLSELDYNIEKLKTKEKEKEKEEENVNSETNKNKSKKIDNTVKAEDYNESNFSSVHIKNEQSMHKSFCKTKKNTKEHKSSFWVSLKKTYYNFTSVIKSGSIFSCLARIDTRKSTESNKKENHRTSEKHISDNSKSINKKIKKERNSMYDSFKMLNRRDNPLWKKVFNSDEFMKNAFKRKYIMGNSYGNHNLNSKFDEHVGSNRNDIIQSSVSNDISVNENRKSQSYDKKSMFSYLLGASRKKNIMDVNKESHDSVYVDTYSKDDMPMKEEEEEDDETTKELGTEKESDKFKNLYVISSDSEKEISERNRIIKNKNKIQRNEKQKEDTEIEILDNKEALESSGESAISDVFILKNNDEIVSALRDQDEYNSNKKFKKDSCSKYHSLKKKKELKERKQRTGYARRKKASLDEVNASDSIKIDSDSDDFIIEYKKEKRKQKEKNKREDSDFSNKVLQYQNELVNARNEYIEILKEIDEVLVQNSHSKILSEKLLKRLHTVSDTKIDDSSSFLRVHENNEEDKSEYIIVKNDEDALIEALEKVRIEKKKHTKVDDEKIRFYKCNEDENEKALNILNEKNESKVLIDKFNVPLLYSQIKCLESKCWLNDEVINFYLSMVQEYNENNRKKEGTSSLPKIYIFSTFFYHSLSSDGYNYKRVQRWTKRKNIDIFSFDMILIPLHVFGNHWTLGAIDIKRKHIKLYDSLNGENIKFFTYILKYLRDEAMDKKRIQMDFSDWIYNKDGKSENGIPFQENGYDCGVFTCMFAKCLSLSRKFDFHQSDINDIRLRMTYDISQGSIKS